MTGVLVGLALAGPVVGFAVGWAVGRRKDAARVGQLEEELQTEREISWGLKAQRDSLARGGLSPDELDAELQHVLRNAPPARTGMSPVHD